MIQAVVAMSLAKDKRLASHQIQPDNCSPCKGVLVEFGKELQKHNDEIKSSSSLRNIAINGRSASSSFPSKRRIEKPHVYKSVETESKF